MKVLIFFPLLVVLICTVGCGGGGGGGEPQLRFINASPDAHPLDLQAEDRVILTANAYLAVAGTNQLAEGNNRVSVRPVGSSAKTTELTISLSSSSNYLLAAINYFSSLRLVLFDYSLASLPERNFSWIRAVHAAPAGPALDFYVASPGLSIRELEPAAANISFGNESRFVQVPSGEYQIRFGRSGSKVQELDVGIVRLASQSVSTIFVAESKAGSSAYASIVLNDREM